MQPPVLPVRSDLSEAQVIAIIRDSPVLRVSAGCELLTGMDLLVAEDITADMAGGKVERQSYADLHGTAQLQLTRDLPWGSAMLRPYITLSDGTVSARFNLGVYFTDTPARDVMEEPVTYDVQCYDVLSVLDDPVGDSYAVAAGTSYLTAVESILQARGVQRYLIDQDASERVLPTDRTWMFDQSRTWLHVVNDLLGSIGYAGVYSDWDGLLRCEPYVSPRVRGAEWVYDVDPYTSMLGGRSVVEDYFDAPNRWVFVQSNRLQDTPPVDGDGRYVFQNTSVGKTSVDGRGGRIRTKVVPLDAADHASLVSAAQSVIDADMQVPTTVSVAVTPNPLHWHFDVVYLADPAVGPPTTVLCPHWTLPLDGSMMTQDWTVIPT